MFSCRCETYPIDFISLSKTSRCKAIRYTYCDKLFVLNGNKRTIRHEFHKGMKPNWYNGNMVLENTDTIFPLYWLAFTPL